MIQIMSNVSHTTSITTLCFDQIIFPTKWSTSQNRCFPLFSKSISIEWLHRLLVEINRGSISIFIYIQNIQKSSLALARHNEILISLIGMMTPIRDGILIHNCYSS